jgi:hypothetical protein
MWRQVFSDFSQCVNVVKSQLAHVVDVKNHGQIAVEDHSSPQ